MGSPIKQNVKHGASSTVIDEFKQKNSSLLQGRRVIEKSITAILLNVSGFSFFFILDCRTWKKLVYMAG